MLRTVLAASLLVGTSALVPVAFTASTAYAACSTNAPASGATVNCPAPLDTTGVSAPGASNVTVNVPDQSSAGISVTGTNGILLGTGANVQVLGSGVVRTAGDNARGVSVGSGSTVNVTGTVATTGGSSDAIFAGDNATVTVGGPGLPSNAMVTSGGQGAAAISVGSNSNVTINANAMVTTSNSQADAIFSSGTGVTVDINEGAVLRTSSGMSSPINLTGANATVTIAGDVRSSAGNANAVNVTGDNANITIEEAGFVNASSSGSNIINATGSGSTVTIEGGANARAINASSGNVAAVSIGNSGTVNIAREVGATSSNAIGVKATNNATVNIQATGKLVASSSQSTAVQLNSTMASSTNRVNIAQGAIIEARGGQAIVATGPGAEMITANGIIEGQSGATAVVLGGGNDMLEVTATGGLRADGTNTLVDGGMGQDTVVLRNAASYNTSRFVNVESIVAGGSGTTVSANANQPMLGLTALNSGSVIVNMGATVGSVTTEGAGTTLINGTVEGTTTTNSGGTTNVGSGGTANNVTTNMGGTTNVGSGGTANLADGPGGGGAQNFASGSNAGVNATADGAAQSRPGTVFGAGTNVTVNNSAFLTGAGAGDTISFNRAADAFSARGANANARALGAALDGGNAGLVERVILTTADQVDQAFASLGGEGYAGAGTGIALSARSFARSLQVQAGAGAAASGAAAFASTVMPGDLAGNVNRQLTANDGTRGADVTPGIRATGVGYAWIGGFGNTTDFDGSLETSGFESKSRGVSAGYEFDGALFGSSFIPGLETVRTGFAVAYSRNDATLDTIPQSAETESLHAGLYTARRYGMFDIASSLTYTYSDTDVERAIFAAGLGAQARSSFDSHTFASSTEVAFDLLETDRFTLAPFAGIDSAYVYSDGFTETGAGVLNLTGSSGWETYTWGTLGAKFGRQIDTANGGVAFEARLAYEHAFTDNGYERSLSFAGSPVGFTTRGADGGEDRLRVGLSAAFKLSDTATMSARYDGSFGDDIRDQSISAKIGFSF